MGHATNYMSCRCYHRIGTPALTRMKTSKPQPAHLHRRTLLQAGLGALGAAAFGLPVLPRIARADTAQAAQLTDADKADIARVEDYLNGMSSVKASFQQYTEGEGLSFGRIYLRRPG